MVTDISDFVYWGDPNHIKLENGVLISLAVLIATACHQKNSIVESLKLKLAYNNME